MCTFSFIAGVTAGISTTALIAGQKDWWVWLLIGIAAVFVKAWKEAGREARKVRNHH